MSDEKIHILVNNLPSDVTEEDIYDAFADLDFELDVKLVPGEKMLAQVSFSGMTRTMADKLAQRINGMFWREHTLQAYVPLFFK